MKKKYIAAILMSVFLVAPSANATKIILNGVDITDVKDKTFNKVKSVHIDPKGDVYIDAPQYEVKVLETGGGSDDNTSAKTKGTNNPAQLKNQYFIASQGPAQKVQYKLTIAINGVVRVEIGANEATAIEEITGWLNKGKNIVRVTAVKEIGTKGRASTDKSDELSLLIGAGHEEEKIIKIDSLKATFKCDASTTNTFTREYQIFAE